MKPKKTYYVLTHVHFSDIFQQQETIWLRIRQTEKKQWEAMEKKERWMDGWIDAMDGCDCDAFMDVMGCLPFPSPDHRQPHLFIAK